MYVCSIKNLIRMLFAIFGKPTVPKIPTVQKIPYSISYKELGRGHYGDVFLGKNTTTNTPVAIKRIRRKASRKLKVIIQNEIDCLNIVKCVPHPNIVKMHDVYEDNKHIWIVMEQCEGEELFDTIKRNTHFAEQDARILMKVILQALVHLKNHDIVHRDLKPENIMVKFNEDGALSSLKLIDFGLSCSKSKRHQSCVGTAYYMAPEVIHKDYDERCDEWSCGVILYILLCGFPPFNGATDTDIMNSIKKGNVTFPAPRWDNISQEAKDLVSQLLMYNVDSRITAKEALSHAWFQSCEDDV